ncbi:MAG TPA: MFS transporter [Jatrophihabitans sp.]|jgi:EmrB/QacA subfamily drug resistance transporter
MSWRQLLIEPARPDRIRGSTRAPWLAVAAVCVGAFMGQLDASIVTVAIPSLRHDLHASLAGVEWVSLSYLLVLVGTVAAVGRWADMTGRKLLYTYGFIVFTLASLGCGLAGSLTVLVVMRVVQALGAAMLQANSVALIRTAVRAEQLPRAIGVQGAAQALGLALGPAIGGLLIGFGGWRWVFYVNVPAGVLGVAMAWLLIPRTRVRAPRARFDWAGVATLLPASAALLLALSLMAQHSRSSAATALGLVLLSACLFTAFVLVERRTAAPLIDLTLFTERRFAAGIAGGMLSYLVLFGVLFVTPLYLEDAYRLGPGAAGLLLTVLPVGLGCTAPFAAHAVHRFGATAAGATGMGLVAVTLAVLAGAPANRGVLIAALAVAGVGLGLFTPSNNTEVAGSGTAQQAGMVSGLMNMIRGIGTALGVAVAGATYALGTSSNGRSSTLASATDGFRISVVVLAVLATASAGLAISGGRSRATVATVRAR